MSDALHQRLFDARHAGQPEWVLDELLGQCPDAECQECGAIICPYAEPLHFHHDGCPACAQHEEST